MSDWLTSCWARPLSVALCAMTLVSVRAHADDCQVAAVGPRGEDREAILREARSHAVSQRYAQARGLYSLLLARDKTDHDARFGLAQAYAWAGCYEPAAKEYRYLLARLPSDVEARAGLTDTLLWDGRWGEARAVLDAGLAHNPEAPSLWLRRARTLHWTAEFSGALASAKRAESLARDDPEIRAFRDGLFVTQLRGGVRGDFYLDAAYPNVYAAMAQALQRWDKVEVTLDAQAIARKVAGENAAAPLRGIVDGRFVAGGLYQVISALALGLQLGLGAPAHAIPRFEGRFAVFGTWWLMTASLAYSLWSYKDDKLVHIVAPTLGFNVSDTLLLEARAWISELVILHAATHEGSRRNPRLTIGGRALWHVRSPLKVSASYTYGLQLDASYPYAAARGAEAAASEVRFLDFTSHVLTLGCDWLMTRGFGLAPLVGLEWRKPEQRAGVLIAIAELSSYLRW